MTYSKSHAPVSFYWFIVSVACSIVFSANPVKLSGRCVAPQVYQ